jgi:hypothetical protein
MRDVPGLDSAPLAFRGDPTNIRAGALLARPSDPGNRLTYDRFRDSQRCAEQSRTRSSLCGDFASSRHGRCAAAAAASQRSGATTDCLATATSIPGPRFSRQTRDAEPFADQEAFKRAEAAIPEERHRTALRRDAVSSRPKPRSRAGTG